MTDPRRFIAVLLREHGPVCERCLAHHARLMPSEAAAVLEGLKGQIALRVEHAECPECHQFTQLFSLGKTRDDVADRG